MVASSRELVRLPALVSLGSALRRLWRRLVGFTYCPQVAAELRRYVVRPASPNEVAENVCRVDESPIGLATKRVGHLVWKRQPDRAHGDSLGPIRFGWRESCR